jgi:thioredoxin
MADFPEALLALHRANREPAPTLTVLGKLLQNIADNPGEEKYRTVKRENKAIRGRILDVKGGEAALVAAGFQPVSGKKKKNKKNNPTTLIVFFPSHLSPWILNLKPNASESNGVTLMNHTLVYTETTGGLCAQDGADLLKFSGTGADAAARAGEVAAAPAAHTAERMSILAAERAAVRAKENAERDRLRAQLEADKKERAARPKAVTAVECDFFFFFFFFFFFISLFHFFLDLAPSRLTFVSTTTITQTTQHAKQLPNGGKGGMSVASTAGGASGGGGRGGGGSGNVQSITSKEQLDALLAGETRPVVVDFYADWCGPCKVIAPLFEQLAAAKKGRVVFCRVNVDDVADGAGERGVTAMPTFHAYVSNSKIGELRGADEAGLTALVDKAEAAAR